MFKTDYISGLEAWGTLDAYACKKCHHVDFYVTEKTIKKYEDQVKKQEEYCRRMDEYQSRKNEIEKEMARLKEIINDENQTVKAVNEAKEKLSGLDFESRNLRPPQRM